MDRPDLTPRASAPRSLRLHAADLAFAAASRIRRARGHIDAAAIVADAASRAASSSHGADATGWRAGFDRLVSAIGTEARLSPLGRHATAGDLVRLVSNLFQLQDRRRRDPAVAERPVTAPIFITGLPRSGTSFLHAILAREPALLAPRTWQVMHPVPKDTRAARRAERSVRWQLRAFGALVPELASLHPIAADTPQECTDIFAHTFLSSRFDTIFDVPSYRAWLDRQDHAPAYALHRAFLQTLQGERAGARWVLKSPDHVFTLAALDREYPDARLVFTHRDPVRVLASVARLTELLRLMFSGHVDRKRIGAQVLRDWNDGMARIMRAADERPDILHVVYEQLVADPIGQTRRVLRAVGHASTPAAERAMSDWVRANRDGGYGRNRYRLTDYGLDESALQRATASYRRRFGLVAA